MDHSATTTRKGRTRQLLRGLPLQRRVMDREPRAAAA
jgi:hypothetical protein